MSDSTAPNRVHRLVPLYYVQDIKAAVEFYTEKLDFRVTQAWEPNGKLTWCQLERGAAAVMLQRITSEDKFAGPRGEGIVFYFHCDDAGEEYQRFTERGMTVEPPFVTFYGMKQVFVTDPDGYQLCFQNPTDPAPSDCIVPE